MGTSYPAPRRDLNAACQCLTLDRNLLSDALRHVSDRAPLFDGLLSAGTSLFSDVPVFLPRVRMTEMQTVIDAIYDVTSSAPYCTEVLSRASAVAQADLGPKGVFMGFDFHVTEGGPKLIEINTNAGGAFLNAVLADAQRVCCNATRPDLKLSPSRFEDEVSAMFQAEWRAQRPIGELRRIAIVDERPAEQFLYPEFLLAQDFFMRNGIDAVIADPEEMEIRGGSLHWKEQPVDLVYNRMVDFAFEETSNAVLRRAYMEGLAVFTPNPRAHALLADKRNLTLLSDAAALERLGVPVALREVLLQAIPKTLAVSEANAQTLWRDRKSYFFKPASGYGSKAVYRGDKLTRTVWSHILTEDYVAQAYVPPSTRRVLLDGLPAERKVDVRLYTYGRKILAVAARLYQGQATNMRTPGGGFAPVFLLDDEGPAAGVEQECRITSDESNA